MIVPPARPEEAMTLINWYFHKDDAAAIAAVLSAMRTGVFCSEFERKAAVFALAKKRRHDWRAVQECSFPGCNEQSIPHSHSLSRALMIQPICEDNHVLGLDVDLNSASYRMRRIGINETSTFPGFCQAHENKFNFEAAGAISNGGQLQRHLFRNICRHIYFLRHEKRSLARYVEELKSRAIPLLDNKLGSADWQSDVGLIRAYILDQLFGNLDLGIAQRSENIDFDVEHWLEPNAANFGRYPGEFGFHDELIQCPSTSVAIATAMLFEDTPRRDDGTPDFRYQYYVSMFPNAGVTHIHLTARQEQRGRLIALAEKFSVPSKATRIVEKWLQDSDHWYMRPSAWAAIDPKIQNWFLESHRQH
jgi:hypothetical protein